MEPNKFRESRQAINRLCKNIDQLIEQKALEASQECYQEATEKLETLTPHAEGEIQERSVKNLGLKMKYLSIHMDKLKPKKKTTRAGKKEPAPMIEWDEDRIGNLAKPFLKKLFTNMGNEPGANVCFGTTGKGIRPSYEIAFDDSKHITFSGSGHKPQAKLLSNGNQKISKPFSYDVIQSILNKK